MKVVDTATELSKNDLWVSMIENWGEANKEYHHCGKAPLEECFLKMSKYMWRMFSAMKLVRRFIPNDSIGLVQFFFEETFADPEYAMRMWLDYKKQGNTAITENQENVIHFLRQFECDRARLGSPLSLECIIKIHNKVNMYNIKLAATVTDPPVEQLWLP